MSDFWVALCSGMTARVYSCIIGDRSDSVVLQRLISASTASPKKRKTKQNLHRFCYDSFSFADQIANATASTATQRVAAKKKFCSPKKSRTVAVTTAMKTWMLTTTILSRRRMNPTLCKLFGVQPTRAITCNMDTHQLARHSPHHHPHLRRRTRTRPRSRPRPTLWPKNGIDTKNKHFQKKSKKTK